MFKNFFRVDIFFGTLSGGVPKRGTENTSPVPHKTEAQIIPARVKSRDRDKKKSTRFNLGGL
jgi:hypothetical protein